MTLVLTPARLVLGATAFLVHAATAQVPAPQYSIKEDQPRTGSHIRKDSVKGFSIPINLSYEQLSAEHKRRVHALYENIADGDEPPFPLAGLVAIYDPLRRAQGRLGDTGELSVVATIDRTGKVQAVKVLKTTSPAMTNFAAQLLMLTQFKPAKCAGEPCVMDFPVSLSMRIE
jgi:hypothetical protein